MKTMLVAVTAVLVSGCAYNLTLMPRDSGRMYTGVLDSDGTGSGSIKIDLDGDTCSGPAARVASNESFGFANTYAMNNRGTQASAFTSGYASGDVTIKALLVCRSGRGVRCDMTGRGSSGGGICVDDSGRVFDVIANRK